MTTSFNYAFTGHQRAIEDCQEFIEKCAPEYSWLKGRKFIYQGRSLSFKQLEEKAWTIYARAAGALKQDYLLVKDAKEWPIACTEPVEQLTAFNIQLKRFQHLCQRTLKDLDESSDRNFFGSNPSGIFQLVLKIHRLVNYLFPYGQRLFTLGCSLPQRCLYAQHNQDSSAPPVTNSRALTMLKKQFHVWPFYELKSKQETALQAEFHQVMSLILPLLREKTL